jgi:molybdate transport system ATP-binding protein
MNTDFDQLDPNRIAAILYRPDDDVDTLLADFACDLADSGTRIGGIVQRNLKDAAGRKIGMQAFDLLSRRNVSICQPLGSGATACRLDSGGLAEAAAAVGRALSEKVALVVINKFSKQEASGQGLRAEFADTIIAGAPLLTAVPEKCIEAWKDFTGDIGTTLLCERRVIDGWWQDISSRMVRMRDNAARSARSTGQAAIFRSSHPMT